MSITYRREMGLTHAELFRLLPRLLPDRQWLEDDGLIHVPDGERHIYIRYQPEAERRIASLRLPVTHISFVFDGYSEVEAGYFMAHFDKTYRRGGG